MSKKSSNFAGVFYKNGKQGNGKRETGNGKRETENGKRKTGKRETEKIN